MAISCTFCYRPGISALSPTTYGGQALWSIGLLSAYSHAEVNERFRILIGFNFEGVNYVYNCLPFGLRTSAYAFAKPTAVTAEVLQRSELVTALIVYLSGFGGSIGPVPVHPRMAQVLAAVESFGWALVVGNASAGK